MLFLLLLNHQWQQAVTQDYCFYEYVALLTLVQALALNFPRSLVGPSKNSLFTSAAAESGVSIWCAVSDTLHKLQPEVVLAKWFQKREWLSHRRGTPSASPRSEQQWSIEKEKYKYQYTKHGEIGEWEHQRLLWSKGWPRPCPPLLSCCSQKLAVLLFIMGKVILVPHGNEICRGDGRWTWFHSLNEAKTTYFPFDSKPVFSIIRLEIRFSWTSVTSFMKSYHELWFNSDVTIY